MSSHPTVTVNILKQLADAFNRHDLDAIMEFFADDGSDDKIIRKDSYWKIVE